MRIKDAITNVLLGMVDEGLIKSQQYNDDYRANIEWGELVTPSAQFHLVTDVAVDVHDGLWNETAKILVFFGESSYIDNDGEQRQDVIDRMMDIAKNFISRVLAIDTLEITTDKVMIYSIYEFGDSGVTGVKTDFEIKNLEGVCL